MVRDIMVREGSGVKKNHSMRRARVLLLLLLLLL
jgi:hypothetical protein